MKMSATGSARKMGQDALDIQDASNIHGVISTLYEFMGKLREHPDFTGCPWMEKNPIIIALIDKLCHLTDIQVTELEPRNVISRAFNLCADLASGQDIEF